ncbi:GxxExxY protein [Hymenobacter caeli]|uniref:GxxExxY protein n=1 Tax=Hymenobacter caeli TaxID=2735894 RepID=A0ABX2FU98_9BACT|nr:GxxExxY protein [Hymenobacter caeli]NRT20768.1 GxxExxY protein [Hymenobacter caeli]
MTQLVDLAEYNELTHKIIGCAMTVHRKLGRGFLEVVYQRSLATELFKQELRAEREIELPVYCEDEKFGSRRVDFFVDGRVVVEIKAASCILPAYHAQLINYLEVFKIPVALLINFGTPSLEFKRFVKAAK